MSNSYFRYVLVVFAYFFISSANALPGESIVLESNTGNYIVTYFGYDDTNGEQKVLRVATFVPATKIDPVVRSSIKMWAGGIVEYKYNLFNKTTSHQAIAKIAIDQISNAISFEQLNKLNQSVQWNALAEDYGIASYPMNSQQGWGSRIVSSQFGGLRASWSSYKSSLPVGKGVGGFGFFSLDLPSIGIAQVRGRSAVREFVDEGPIGEVGDKLAELVKSDFVPRSIAVPMIAVPTPFDPAIVLDNLRTHVATWPSKQLADATFAAQLDRYLLSAAEAYRHNQPKAGKEHIETLRDMLKRVHKDLEDDDDEGDEEHDDSHGDKHGNHHAATQATSIDRLAARVLDFDLKYVLKRMKVEDKSTH